MYFFFLIDLECSKYQSTKRDRHVFVGQKICIQETNVTSYIFIYILICYKYIIMIKSVGMKHKTVQATF